MYFTKKTRIPGERTLSLLFSFILASALLAGCSPSPEGGAEPGIDELLAPYQEVIDRVNEDFDYTFFIKEDKKQSFYDAYKDMPLDEFEAKLREDYEEILRQKDAPIPEEPRPSGEIDFEYFDVSTAAEP